MQIQRAKNGKEKSFMNDKIFIDTNLLIYALDEHNPLKKEKARKSLREIKSKYNGVISTQVMQEFFVAATRKLHADALIVRDILRYMENF